jgi:hypothetical protein
MGETRDIELKVGRRSADGIVRLSAYPPQLVQLTVGYRGQQSASVLLTQEQIRELQVALGNYMETTTAERETKQTWDHTERRSEESLL